MSSSYDPNDLAKLSDGERAFIESIDDDHKREAVACSLILHRLPDRLFENDDVPNLDLRPLSGEARVGLRDFVGDRPVLLVFGSYT